MGAMLSAHWIFTNLGRSYYYYNHFIFHLKILKNLFICLFVCLETMCKWVRGTEGDGEGESQADSMLSGEPDAGFDLTTWDHDLSWIQKSFA